MNDDCIKSLHALCIVTVTFTFTSHNELFCFPRMIYLFNCIISIILESKNFGPLVHAIYSVCKNTTK